MATGLPLVADVKKTPFPANKDKDQTCPNNTALHQPGQKYGSSLNYLGS